MIGLSRPLKGIPTSLWPKVDKHRLFEARVNSGFNSLKAETVRRIELAYGRWLAFLGAAGKLDPTASPAGRVRRHVVAEYIAAMQRVGFSPATVVAYLKYLRAALKVLEPSKDFAWVRSPQDRKAIKRSPTSPFLEEFPAVDLQLWRAGERSDQNPESTSTCRYLSWRTISDAGYAYRSWIRFLRLNGYAVDDAEPSVRLSVIAVSRYKKSLDDSGYSAKKVSRILSRLRMACRIMRLPFPALDSGRCRRPSTELHGLADKFSDWPTIDKRLWIAGTSPGDILDGPVYGATLRPATVATVISDYGYWLRFLKAKNALDPEMLPANRVNMGNLREFLNEMKAQNICNTTILNRIYRMRSALRVMQPDVDMDWIASPGGRSISSFFPVAKKPLKFIHSRILYEWGWELMREASASPRTQQRRVQYRDGLLIALFAARAPRLASMECLQLGKNVLRHRSEIRFIFESEDMKNGKHIEYFVPPTLTPAIERYLAVERGEMMAGQDHDQFWITRHGAPMKAGGIDAIIRSRSKVRFGWTFHPHFFRHCLGTTGPMEDPAHPGVAASILNITSRVLQEHYTRAGEAEAAQRFHSSLRGQRERTRAIANREFRRKRRT